jgi:phosphoglycolate phosphatase
MYLIFDFDGTLVNSFCNVIDKFNLLADEFSFRKISSHEIEGLRNLNSRELIKFLRIPLYKLPKVIQKARNSIHAYMQTLSSFENLPQVLQKLCQAGVSLGILTSNSKENVLTWLQHHKLRDLFNFIHVESNFFGKKRILKKIMKRYQITEAEAFYVGDETRDIDAAKQSGMHAVAVTWGFNSEQTLLSYEPEFVARKSEDLLTICGLDQAGA